MSERVACFASTVVLSSETNNRSSPSRTSFSVEQAQPNNPPHLISSFVTGVHEYTLPRRNPCPRTGKFLTGLGLNCVSCRLSLLFFPAKHRRATYVCPSADFLHCYLELFDRLEFDRCFRDGYDSSNTDGGGGGCGQEGGRCTLLLLYSELSKLTGSSGALSIRRERRLMQVWRGCDTAFVGSNMHAFSSVGVHCAFPTAGQTAHRAWTTSNDCLGLRMDLALFLRGLFIAIGDVERGGADQTRRAGLRFAMTHSASKFLVFRGRSSHRRLC